MKHASLSFRTCAIALDCIHKPHLIRSQKKLLRNRTKDIVPCVALYEWNRDNKTFTKYRNSSIRRVEYYVCYDAIPANFYCFHSREHYFLQYVFTILLDLPVEGSKKWQGPLIRKNAESKNVNVFQLKMSIHICLGFILDRESIICSVTLQNLCRLCYKLYSLWQDKFSGRNQFENLKKEIKFIEILP